MTNSIKYAPIIFFQTMMTIVLLVFLFGPINWGISNYGLVTLYLVLIQFTLFIGYVSGIRTNRWGNRSNNLSKQTVPLKLLGISIILNLVLSIPTIYVRSGGDFSNLIRGVSSPGEVYLLSRSYVISGNYTEYFNIILAPIVWPLVVWLFFYWEHLSRKYKTFGLIAILLYAIFPYIASGTNKGLLDVILMFIVGRASAKIYFDDLSQTNIRKGILAYFKKYKLPIISIILAAAFLNYFSSNISHRIGGGYNNYRAPHMLLHRAESASVSDYIAQSNLSDSAIASLVSMTSYMTQGYYGLSLSLKQDYIPTYGLGHSRFLSWLVGEKLLGVNFYVDSYPVRVAESTGWSDKISWSSVYPWFASDLTFLGVPILFFVIGRLLAKTWVSVVLDGDKWGLTVFSLLCVMLVYSSANNQIFQSGITTSVFIVSLIFWIRSRRNSNAN